MRSQAVVDENGVGHVEIKGALLDKSPAIYEKLGLVTTYKTIKREASELLSSGARAIMFHVDSPGGTVAGCAECAEFIASIPHSGAYATGMACSAAYKLSCSAGAIGATHSAEIGNIGTILSWADCSEFWKANGVEFKALTNDGADLKSTFHIEPDETQIAFLQESINQAGEEFKSWVRENRPAIDEEVFRAGWYHGQRAAMLGLADQIGSMEEFYKEHFLHAI